MRKAKPEQLSIRTTADLRDMLISTIEDVRRGSLDYRQASAIGNLTTKILQSAKLDLEVLKFQSLSGGSTNPVLQLASAPVIDAPSQELDSPSQEAL